MTSEEFAARFGAGLRTLREARGWTQSQLAVAAGVSSNYVARLERAELGASFFLAYQICDALDANVAEVLTITSLPPK